MNIVETYAPTLKHLEEQLRPHDPVIMSWTAGPQPGSTSDIWGTEPFILIQTEDPYCLLYTSPSPRDRTRSRMPSSA